MNKGENSDKEMKITYVAKDQIWKDYVKNCNNAARKWPETWGFLAVNDQKQIKSSKENYHLSDERFVKSARPVPSTSAGMIGWRSTDFNCRLEKYGSYCKGRRTITKSLKWPDEAI